MSPNRVDHALAQVITIIAAAAVAAATIATNHDHGSYLQDIRLSGYHLRISLKILQAKKS